MESITTFYRIQRDPLFQKGLERGRTETQKKMELRELRAIQKRNREFAEWLLSNSDFSLEKIAASTGVEVKDIKRIKARLEKQKADAN